MNDRTTYLIEEKLYTVYTAASGDYCITISEYGKKDESYNLGSKEEALMFILSHFEVNEEIEKEI